MIGKNDKMCSNGLRKRRIQPVKKKIPLSVNVHKAKGIVGLLLAIMISAIYIFGYGSRWMGCLFFVLFTVAGCLKLEFSGKYSVFFVYACWTALCVGLTLLFPIYELFLESTRWVIDNCITSRTVVMNLLLIASGLCLFFSLTGRWNWSVAILTSILFLLAVINGYIYRFRGKEFLFSDMMSAKTAFNVAGQYDLRPQYHTFRAVSVMVLVLFLGFCLPGGAPGKQMKKRATALLLSAGLFAGLCVATEGMVMYNWDAEGTMFNGYYANFYMSIRDFFVKKPEAYSASGIRDLETEYSLEALSPEEELPNILIIMNESFADLGVFGQALCTNQPVMPYFDSLEENTISGQALTSVYGGGTANAEFECLTGFSMEFLPDNPETIEQVDDAGCLDGQK